MTDEPLSDEQLAEIRARATVSWQMLENTDTISVEVALTKDALALLAEVERLREELAYKGALLDKAVRQCPNFHWHE